MADSRPASKRPIRSMRRSELEQEARRFEIKNLDRYTVRELRLVVGARIAKEAGR
jgi:hypothetical protein